MTQTTDDGRFGPAWRMKQDYKFSEFSNFDHFRIMVKEHRRNWKVVMNKKEHEEETLGETTGVDEYEGALTEAEGLGAGSSNTSL